MVVDETPVDSEVLPICGGELNWPVVHESTKNCIRRCVDLDAGDRALVDRSPDGFTDGDRRRLDHVDAPLGPIEELVGGWWELINEIPGHRHAVGGVASHGCHSVRRFSRISDSIS